MSACCAPYLNLNLEHFGSPILLSSFWPFKERGSADQALLKTLRALASTVESEPGTLFYSVSLVEPSSTSPTPIELHDGIQFVECYKDSQAFSDHVKGVPFTTFLKANLHYFKVDPSNPSSVAVTNFYYSPLAFTQKPLPDISCEGVNRSKEEEEEGNDEKCSEQNQTTPNYSPLGVISRWALKKGGSGITESLAKGSISLITTTSASIEGVIVNSVSLEEKKAPLDSQSNPLPASSIITPPQDQTVLTFVSFFESAAEGWDQFQNSDALTAFKEANADCFEHDANNKEKDIEKETLFLKPLSWTAKCVSKNVVVRQGEAPQQAHHDDNEEAQ